jgi:DNA replication and repair protein RecF
MRLTWVELRRFRNHDHTVLRPLPDGLSVVVGPNGEGKTNLLEGMYVLYALTSPRVSANSALVQDGHDAAYARGEFETAGGRMLVEVEIPGKGASRVQLNRSPVRRKRELRRQVRCVLFGPFDLPIVMGDPSKRRTFLDEAVTALWPSKDAAFSAYDRALRQRNRLLKEWDRPGAPAGIEAWDEELVGAGAAVVAAHA